MVKRLPCKTNLLCHISNNFRKKNGAFQSALSSRTFKMHSKSGLVSSLLHEKKIKFLLVTESPNSQA